MNQIKPKRIKPKKCWRCQSTWLYCSDKDNFNYKCMMCGAVQ